MGSAKCGCALKNLVIGVSYAVIPPYRPYRVHNAECRFGSCGGTFMSSSPQQRWRLVAQKNGGLALPERQASPPFFCLDQTTSHRQADESMSVSPLVVLVFHTVHCPLGLGLGLSHNL